MQLAQFFQGWRQREIALVLGLGLVSVLLWHVPLLGWIFYPFQLFGTFVHELCHGLAAIITGGEFRRFAVHPNLSGVAFSAGGIRWIIISAGYVGSALFGSLLVLLSAWNAPARRVLIGMGVVLGLLCLLFVRNLFGIASGLAIAAALIWAGRTLSARWADGLLLFLAVQMMLNAINSLFDLVQLSTLRSGLPTDAEIMARLTGIPAVVWAVLWTAIALGCLVGSLRLAYYRTPAPIQNQIQVV